MSGLKQWVPLTGGAWALAAAVLLLVVGGIVILAGPVHSRFLRLEETIVAKEQKAAHNLRVLAPASKDSVLRQYADFGELLKKHGSTAEENAAMLAELDKIASGEGISFSATKPRDPRIEKDYEQYEVEMEFDADMARLIRFAYAVEFSPQLLKVQKMAVDSRKSSVPDGVRASLLVSKVVTL